MPILFLCAAAMVIDGDTLRCRPAGEPAFVVRLARIDAPELPGHCRDGRKPSGRACVDGDGAAARAALAAMLAGPVTCAVVDASPRRSGFQGADRYGRIVARCTVRGRDLGVAMVAGGWARMWEERR